MTKASFRFSPQILARLGEELNQTPDQSIGELVKNAYDADARQCTIELVDVGKPGGSIVVTDDGEGMEPAAIRDKWLVLGRSSKSSSQTTRLGRTPAGSKGLGRLAALRMGRSVELSSVPLTNSRRIHSLSIDWSAFDNARVVEEVELTIKTSKNSTSRTNGTRTEIADLRNGITSDELKRLARALLLLADPFSELAAREDKPSSGGFAIKLVAPEFREVEALLRKKYFEDASFHLRAEVRDDGSAAAQILDWQSKELATATLADLRKSKKPAPYLAPRATLDLWVFILSPAEDAFSARKATKGEIQAWLKQFGGVHIYQDGIRVAPYGNPGNDWLEMNLTRARNPEERPSTNTSIGRLVLSNKGKFALKQKTDRSGFIEDGSFHELRSFAVDALSWMARWRMELAEQRRTRERTEAPRKALLQRQKVEQAISSAPPAIRKNIEQAFAGYEKTRDQEADALRKEVQLYRTLSTAGITAATFSHESDGNQLKRIELSVNTLKRRIPQHVKEASQTKLLTPLSEIEKAAAGLAVLGSATLSLVKAHKRRVGRVDVHEVLAGLLDIFAPFLASRATSVQKKLADANPFLRTSEAALESVFANLLTNALDAFERAGSVERLIRIETRVTGKTVEVVVSDSGPGFGDFRVEDIWNPGFTSDPDGTGLGLTIVRDTLRDIGGTIEALSEGSLGGAEFVVSLPILGS
jgi:signal transduction histidine kinase